MSQLALKLLGLAIFLACASNVLGQQTSVSSKPIVELCWVETSPIEGLTRERGFQTSCDPSDIAYPHIKPALVLTSANVTEAVLTSHSMGGGQHYMVTIHLTNKARDELAATANGKQTLPLTVIVDGKCWGIRHYVRDEKMAFVPDQARASTFRPSVGFFSSETEARRLLNAFRKADESAK